MRVGASVGRLEGSTVGLSVPGTHVLKGYSQSPDGSNVESSVGNSVGVILSFLVGTSVGPSVEPLVGTSVGLLVRRLATNVGSNVGCPVGASVGLKVGTTDGPRVGNTDGYIDGLTVGVAVYPSGLCAFSVGKNVGNCVGFLLGSNVGVYVVDSPGPRTYFALVSLKSSDEISITLPFWMESKKSLIVLSAMLPGIATLASTVPGIVLFMRKEMTYCPEYIWSDEISRAETIPELSSCD